MRVLVCGGRDFTDASMLWGALDRLLNPEGEPLPPPGHVLIHGGARGADLLADAWAIANWVDVDMHPADWRAYGKGAGHIRNQRMLDEGKPDLVVAFPGGRGTADMVRRARKAGVTVKEIAP